VGVVCRKVKESSVGEVLQCAGTMFHTCRRTLVEVLLYCLHGYSAPYP
jgi:hypothetical protein